jgi:ribosomal protein S18 acetylase RimI-like enzyme
MFEYVTFRDVYINRPNQYRVECVKDNTVVGSCLCTVYNNGAATIMMIDSVLVNGKYRNHGYGKRIIETAIDSAKKGSIDCVELVVNKDNKIARKVYKSAGFEKTNKIHYRRILNVK